MEFIFFVLIFGGIAYLVSKNSQGAIISSDSVESSIYVNCRICKGRLSEKTVKYELVNEEDNSKTAFCNSCYHSFREENPQYFVKSKTKSAKVTSQKTDDSSKNVLKHLDAAANSKQPVRILYHGEKGSRERMIQPINVDGSRRQYVCLEENIVKNFSPSKMEVITEDGEVFGLGKAKIIKEYSSTYQVKEEVVRLRPELEDFIDVSETHLKFKIIGKRGKFLKYPRFGIEHKSHRESRPWVSEIPDKVSYYKHLDKAAYLLIENIDKFDVERDFHS
jgi:hypothetical protein